MAFNPTMWQAIQMNLNHPSTRGTQTARRTRDQGIPFTKLHGLGNDFVLIDLRDDVTGVLRKRLTQPLIRAIADRKRGVGFDQLLVLRASLRGHAALEIYNADGSVAEMCGNGLRAAVLFLWKRGALDQELIIETAAGDRRARLLMPLPASVGRIHRVTRRAIRRASAGDAPLIECDMGVPKILATPQALKRGIRLGGKTRHPVCVSVGNPHAVMFAYPQAARDLAKWGSTVETHKAFPRRTNVEFVRVKNSQVIEVQVWERGVGVTEACGTGAVAAAVAAIHEGLVRTPVEVRFSGGQAEVRWTGPGQPAFLTGRAQEVFAGVWRTEG